MSGRRRVAAIAILAAACASSNGRESSSPGVDAAWSLASFTDGARVTDTRLPLEAIAAPGADFEEVRYAIDGALVVTRRASPWGWGEGGARVRDAGEMSFGAHEIRIEARTKRGRTSSRVLHVVYVSPFAHVPSYARDVAPLFHAHCASCHDHGLARDLASYERLRAMIPRLRASVRERRMPPDFVLDAPSVALITAWCDGSAPP